jgi:hypothetical protein
MRQPEAHGRPEGDEGLPVRALPTGLRRTPTAPHAQRPGRNPGRLVRALSAAAMLARFEV